MLQWQRLVQSHWIHKIKTGRCTAMGVMSVLPPSEHRSARPASQLQPWLMYSLWWTGIFWGSNPINFSILKNNTYEEGSFSNYKRKVRKHRNAQRRKYKYPTFHHLGSWCRFSTGFFWSLQLKNSGIICSVWCFPQWIHKPTQTSSCVLRIDRCDYNHWIRSAAPWMWNRSFF